MSANRVHPTAVVEGDVEIGAGNVLMPYSVIVGPCRLGDGNWIGAHAVLGTPPQHSAGGGRPTWDEPQGPWPVEIGDGNTISPFVAVTHGTRRATRIGDGCLLMSGSYAGHDVVYEDGVTLAANVSTGGHVVLGEGTTLGLGATVHQRLVVGAYVMVGMGAAVTTDLPPFALALGMPARIVGANRVGMERAGFDSRDIDAVDAHYRTSPAVTVTNGVSDRILGLLAAHDERVAQRDRWFTGVRGVARG